MDKLGLDVESVQEINRYHTFIVLVWLKCDKLNLMASLTRKLESNCWNILVARCLYIYMNNNIDRCLYEELYQRC